MFYAMFGFFLGTRPLERTTFAIKTSAVTVTMPSQLKRGQPGGEAQDPPQLHPQGHRHKMLRNYSPEDRKLEMWLTLTGTFSLFFSSMNMMEKLLGMKPYKDVENIISFPGGVYGVDQEVHLQREDY